MLASKSPVKKCHVGSPHMWVTCWRWRYARSHSHVFIQWFLEPEVSDVLWNKRIRNTCPFLNDSDDLASISKLIVVPNVQHHSIVINNRGFTIYDAGMTVAH